MKKVKALVVEDSKNMADIFISQLSSIGVENTHLAADGVIALELIIKEASLGAPFDIIFCDYQMPNKSGMDLFRDLLARDGENRTPFILVTASGDDRESLLSFISEGITDFLVKPVKKESLLEKLNKIFES